MLEKPNPEVNTIEKLTRDPRIPETVYDMIEAKLEYMDDPDPKVRKHALLRLVDSLLKIQLDGRKTALDHAAKLYQQKELYLKMTFELCRRIQALRQETGQPTGAENAAKLWDEIRDQVVSKEIAKLDPDRE